MISITNNNLSPISTITQKKSANDLRKKVLVITNHPLKKIEFLEILEKRYGALVNFESSPESMTEQVVLDILSKANPSPQYILREESKLFDTKQNELDGLDVVNQPQHYARKIISTVSQIKVWMPEWKDGALKTIKLQEYTCKQTGSIDPKYASLKNETVMGWDHLFITHQLGLSTLAMIQSPYGKISARQLALDEFLQKHFVYEKPKNLQHNRELFPKEGVEFNLEMSVGKFFKRNSCLNAVVNSSKWPLLYPIVTKILNEGVYFKAGTSRPMQNYFSPPFGGIPLTAKKTLVEETIFMYHDLHHHLVPDLVLTGTSQLGNENVYGAWRMMSEAITMIFADMFYADVLNEKNSLHKESFSKDIYPLFQALDLSKASPSGDSEEMMKAILYANVQFAVLGDDSYWRNLIKEGKEDKLIAFKLHFEKFFIGDHAWTHANYQSMVSQNEFYKTWLEWVGKEEFNRANLILVDEMLEKINDKGADLKSFKDVCLHLFNEIIEARIFTKENVSELDEEQRISNAFHRYMIGQMTFYVHYKEIPSVKERAHAMASKLKSTPFFNEEEITEIRDRFFDDVMYVLGMGALSESTAENYAEMHPIFPPVYINYNKQECQSVKAIVTQLYEK